MAAVAGYLDAKSLGYFCVLWVILITEHVLGYLLWPLKTNKSRITYYFKADILELRRFFITCPPL